MHSKNNITAFTVFCIIAIFAAGASAGFFFSAVIGGEEVEIPEMEPQVKVVTKVEQQVTTLGDDSEKEELRAKIRELEDTVAKLSENRRGRGMRDRDVRNDEQDGAQPNQEERPKRMSFKERMEKMKTENPERYAEIQKHISERKEAMRAESENRRSFFASIDTSRMTPEQKENHTALLNAIAVTDSFAERFAPDSETRPTQEEREEFFTTIRQMPALMEEERRYILGELATDCGLDSGDFIEYIESVYSQTALMGGPGRRGGMPPPPGGPGAPGGPR